MRYAVNSSEMKSYDRNTSEFFGLSSDVLMERAALKVCDHIKEWADEHNSQRKLRALIVSGTGNNGGDGVAISRLLKQSGFLVNLCIVGDFTNLSDMALKQLRIAEKYGIIGDTFSNIRDNKNTSEWDIIVDAIFGIGLSRAATGDFKEAIDYINECKKERADDLYVVSVDMPSGVSADNGQVLGCAVKADATITFNQTKIGQILYPGCEYAGKLFVEDVGITDESFRGKTPGAFFYDEDATNLLPERKKDGNKGTNGKVLIIAGSKEVSGACVLCASACLKAGAGMVRIFTAKENAEAVKTLLPEAMLDTYEDYQVATESLDKAFEWSTCLVIGPGIGTGPRGAELVEHVLTRYDKDVLMDADALNILSMDEKLKNLASNYSRNGRRLILTPHLAEFARLIGRNVGDCKSNLLEYPLVLAKTMHCTIICKDARSIVADSNEKKIYINVSGNDGMATAGSGDVLSGIIGAFFSFGKSGFETATLGAYVHGAAGDVAMARRGRYSMIASDIIDSLKDILV